MLIVELNDNIQKKFLFINRLIVIRKCQSRNLRKILLKNSAQHIQKLENEERAFVSRNIGGIMETHYDMMMVCRHLNDLFEFPILITLITNFQSITLTLYYIVIVLENLENANSFHPELLQILCPVFILGQVTLMIWSFDNLATEVGVL